MTDTLFARKIVQWYQEHRRPLPWRQTRDPYRIWLSEIILQQTRVAQGLPYYHSFIKEFPRLKQLAEASERDVLRLWQGLGYYSRARNLHACAKTVQKKYHGKFPASFSALRELEGIGDYTAAAIASFAFHERVAVVDGNVLRVLSRVFGIHEDIASSRGKRKFSELANRLVPQTDPDTYNQAIMEFGALQCVPRNPRCYGCPVSGQCVAFKRGLQETLPIKRKQTKSRARYFNYLVIRSGNRWLMKERKDRDIWKSLYDFPLYESKSPLNGSRLVAALNGVTGELVDHKHSTITKARPHVLSHQIIHARFVEVHLPKAKIPKTSIFEGSRFFSSAQVKKLPKSVLISSYLGERGVL